MHRSPASVTTCVGRLNGQDESSDLGILLSIAIRGTEAASMLLSFATALCER
jgi:hypothetical protein